MPLNTSGNLKKIVEVGDDFLFSSQPTQIRRRKRNNCKWAADSEQIQKLLLKVFPKLHTDLVQRRGAARWAHVIQLYFRTALSYSEVAEEMYEKKETIHNIIRRIQRAKKGKPVNGIPRKRKRDPIPTGFGEQDKGPVGEPQNRLTL